MTEQTTKQMKIQLSKLKDTFDSSGGLTREHAFDLLELAKKLQDRLEDLEQNLGKSLDVLYENKTTS